MYGYVGRGGDFVKKAIRKVQDVGEKKGPLAGWGPHSAGLRRKMQNLRKSKNSKFLVV